MLFRSIICRLITIVICNFIIFAAFSQNINSIPVPDSLDGTTICGDLQAFTHNTQLEYRNFKEGLPSSMRSTGSLEPEAIFECGSFTVYYEDFLVPDGEPLGGFADPAEGAARRAVLCEVLSYVEEVLFIHPDANPTIRVEQSFYAPGNPAGSGDGYLASANSIYNEDLGYIQGIYNGHIFNYINSGIDPDCAFDGRMNVNFHQSAPSAPIVYFTSQVDPPNILAYDLKTILLHEVTHMLGIASQIIEGENGDAECFNPENSFTRYDWEVLHYGDILNPSSFTGNKLVIGINENDAHINQSINANEYPLRRSNLWLYDEGPPLNHSVLAGIPIFEIDHPYYSNPGSTRSFISHLGNNHSNFSQRFQFSPGRDYEYVMESSIYHQAIISEWSLAE